MTEQKILILEIDPIPAKWLYEKLAATDFASELRPFQESILLEDIYASRPDIVIISGDLYLYPNFVKNLMKLHRLGVPSFACRSIEQAEILLNSIILENEEREESFQQNTSQGIHHALWKSTFISPAEFYRALVEDMPIMVIRIAVDGTLRYVNQHFCDFYHASPDELIGKNLMDFFPEEEQNILRDHLHSFTRENPFKSFELPVRHSDGKTYWLLWRERAVFDEKGGTIGYQSVCQDITKQKELEQELRASEQKFRAAVDTMAEGFMLLSPLQDKNGETIDYQVDFINNFGNSNLPYNLQGKRISEIHHLYTDDPDFLQKLIEVGNTGKSLIVDRYDRIDPDTQEILWSTELRASRFQDALVVLWRDITAKTQADEEIKNARDSLVNLSEISKQFLSFHDVSRVLNIFMEKINELVPSDNAAFFTIKDDNVTASAYNNWFRYRELEINFDRIFAEIIRPRLITGDINENYLLVDDSYEPDKFIEELIPILGKESRFFVENRSIHVVPLVYQNRLLGIVALLHHDPHIYTENVRAVAKAFANVASLAIENARLTQQDQSQAVMMERLRLARELHDSVTQSLYSINLFSDAARTALEAGRLEKVAGYLHELHDLALGGTKELRMLIFELRPKELDELGLAGAIRSRLDSVERRCGLEAKLEVSGFGQISANVENDLYQITQEALNNIVKHANATKVNLTLGYLSSQIRMEIMDNGIGFDPEQNHAGTGLATIRERIESINGQLKVISQKNKGTILQIEIPK